MRRRQEEEDCLPSFILKKRRKKKGIWEVGCSLLSAWKGTFGHTHAGKWEEEQEEEEGRRRQEGRQGQKEKTLFPTRLHVRGRNTITQPHAPTLFFFLCESTALLFPLLLSARTGQEASPCLKKRQEDKRPPSPLPLLVQASPPLTLISLASLCLGRQAGLTLYLCLLPVPSSPAPPHCPLIPLLHACLFLLPSCRTYLPLHAGRKEKKRQGRQAGHHHLGLRGWAGKELLTCHGACLPLPHAPSLSASPFFCLAVRRAWAGAGRHTSLPPLPPHPLPTWHLTTM